MKWVYLSDLLSNTLNKQNFTEKSIFVNEGTVLFVTLSYHTCDSVSEGLSVDEPKKWGFKSLYWSWSGCWVQKCQLSETFSSFNVSFNSSVDLHS